MSGNRALQCLILGALLSASPALAQTAQQRAEIKTNQLDAQGRDYFSRGEAAEADGNYSAACDNFKGAAAAWQNANWANIGMLTEIGQDGLYDKDVVRANGQALGRNSQAADARARAVCGKPNVVRSAPNYSSGSTSGGGSSNRSAPAYVRPNMSSQVAALQATINAGYGFAQAAVTRYGARDGAGSCQNANNAATSYKQAQTEARAILKAAGSYHDVGVLDLRAIDANAVKAETEARDFYCRPIVAAPNFSAEIRAFMVMKAELHLERGTVTPMPSPRALAGRRACTTDNLSAAQDRGSVMAIAINDGCQAFVLMYNMTLPSHACDTLNRATLSLANVEPIYATEAKILTRNFGEVSRAFKCSPPRGATSSSAVFEGQSDLKEIPPSYPPPLLDTKPFPGRPAASAR